MASLSIYVALCLAICMVRVNTAEISDCTAQQNHICRIHAGPGEEVDCDKAQCISICVYRRSDGYKYATVYYAPKGSSCVLPTGYPGRCFDDLCLAFKNAKEE